MTTRIKEQRADLDAAQADLDALGLHTAAGSIEISTSVSETVASAVEKEERPQQAFDATGGNLLVAASDIAGTGFEPGTFGL